MEFWDRVQPCKVLELSSARSRQSCCPCTSKLFQELWLDTDTVPASLWANDKFLNIIALEKVVKWRAQQIQKVFVYTRSTTNLIVLKIKCFKRRKSCSYKRLNAIAYGLGLVLCSWSRWRFTWTSRTEWLFSDVYQSAGNVGDDIEREQKWRKLVWLAA